jgi:hypothetical protein
MDATLVSALAAVLGSLVGGSATVATAWITQNTLRKHERIGAEIRQRETLYAEFIRESSKLVVDSFAHTLERPETLLSAYELINRIRLSASDAVLAEAENVLRQITDLYFSPNLSVAEIHELVRSGTADPVKPFAEACRSELKLIKRTER